MGSVVGGVGCGSGMDLFRSEALQAHATRWLGEIHIATPPRRWIVVGLALLFTGAIVAYLFLGEYTRRETVPGTLVPAAGLLNLDALQAGVVRQMFAHVGQVVRVGQPLLEIDGSPASAGLGSAAVVEIAQLRAQQFTLQGDLRDQQGLARSQVDALRGRIAGFEAQVAQIEGQIALQRQSVHSLEALLAKIEPLGKKGYVSALEIQQQQLAALNARAQLKSLRSQRAALRSQPATRSSNWRRCRCRSPPSAMPRRISWRSCNPRWRRSRRRRGRSCARRAPASSRPWWSSPACRSVPAKPC